MQTIHISPESVFQHHLAALANNDLQEVLKDYTEDSELWSPDGEIAGVDAISAFYSFVFTIFPKGSTTLEIKKMTSKGDKVFVIWTADSPAVTVSFATDCFEIKDEKIVWQSTAYQMVQK